MTADLLANAFIRFESREHGAPITCSRKAASFEAAIADAKAFVDGDHKKRAIVRAYGNGRCTLPTFSKEFLSASWLD